MAKPRIKIFYERFNITISKPIVKQDAKLAKCFLVLVKRKLQREQVCRSASFRTLQALVYKDRFLEARC